MQALATLCYASLRATGAVALARHVRKGGLILCYHNVVTERPGASVGDTGLHMRVDRFREQMGWLAANYEVVSLAEFVACLAAGTSLHRVATITFDDAYAGVFMSALPLLRAFGLPATVFVVAGAAEHREPFWWDHAAVQRLLTPARREHWLGALRGDGDAILRHLGVYGLPPVPLPADYLPAGWDAVAAAARAGVTLGVHSDTHRTLSHLTDADLQRELVASRDVLRLRTDADAEFFAYPYGLSDARVRDAIRAAGYRAACTLDYGLAVPQADRWALPRVNVPATIGPAAFQAWSAGLSLRRLIPP